VDKLRAEAFDAVRQLMEDFPGGDDPLLLMGKLHRQFGEREDARRWWRRIPRRSARWSEAQYGIATLALEDGQCEEAVAVLRQVRARAPHLPGVHRLLGAALLEMGKTTESIEPLQEQLRRYPKDRIARRLLGEAHLQLRQFDKAVAEYEQLLELAPNDASACYGLATAHARLGENELAQRYRHRFRKLSQASRGARLSAREATDPQWFAETVAKILTDVGKAYLRRRRPSTAESHWQRAAKLDPRDLACRQSLVALYVTTGRNIAAMEVTEQLRQIEPRNPVHHLSIGALHARAKRFDKAEEAIRHAIELDPDGPKGYQELVGLLLYGMKDFQQAQAVAEELVRKDGSAANYYVLGVAREKNADLAGALVAYQQACKLDPKNNNASRARKRVQDLAPPERPGKEE